MHKLPYNTLFNLHVIDSNEWINVKPYALRSLPISLGSMPTPDGWYNWFINLYHSMCALIHLWHTWYVPLSICDLLIFKVQLDISVFSRDTAKDPKLIASLPSVQKDIDVDLNEYDQSKGNLSACKRYLGFSKIWYLIHRLKHIFRYYPTNKQTKWGVYITVF